MLVDDFLVYLLPDVPNCPPLVASRALMFAATEFCEATQVLNAFIDPPLSLVDGTYVYTVPAPEGQQVCALLDVYGPAGPLTPKTMPQISQLLGNWLQAQGMPIYFNGTADNNQVRLFPNPYNVTGTTLVLRAAFKPTLGSTDIPDVLISNCHEAILSGAKARLFMEPGKPWSNAPLGKYHQDLFEAAKIDVRVQVLHENVGSNVTAVAPLFGF